MNEKSNVSCPHCSAHDVGLLGKLPDSRWFAGKRLEKQLPGGDLYRCRNCQLKFRYPLYGADVYRQLYDNAEVSTWTVDAVRRDWELVTRCITRHLPRGGSILDFGCYTGDLLARLDPIYERYGVEINRAAAAVATAERRVQVWPSVSDIPSGSRFDVVVASDVVEHMSDPGRLIEDLFSHLADDGILIITTGDADNYLWNRFGANWWYCFYPEHVSFISRAWLDRFSIAHGHFIERCENFRYCPLPGWKLFPATALTYIYGRLPSVYLDVTNWLRNKLGRSEMTSIPGNGISADHLLVVMARNRTES
jgi:2-polyprenyl-3-methyl-5-hydroxy-6-metoxy-1,4-benzoquinol methylase